MITLQHGVLHRKQTIASGGGYCDYYMTFSIGASGCPKRMLFAIVSRNR